MTEPARVVAIITRESAEQLASEARDGRGGGREGDERDGGEMRRRSAVAGAAGARRSRRRRLEPRRPAAIEPPRGRSSWPLRRSPRCCPGSSPTPPTPSAARTRWPSRSGAARRSTSTCPRARSTRKRCSREQLARKPVAFATNSLVVIVPRSNPAKIKTVFDLAKRPKLRLVVAGPKVPIGLYTREVLKRLGLLRVLKKTVSLEPDVKGIVGKVALGQADAGFVYLTDVAPVADRARAIAIPARAQPTVVYELAIAAKPRRHRGRPGLRHLRSRPGRTAPAARRALRAPVRLTPFARAARGRDHRSAGRSCSSRSSRSSPSSRPAICATGSPARSHAMRSASRSRRTSWRWR